MKESSKYIIIEEFTELKPDIPEEKKKEIIEYFEKRKEIWMMNL